MTGTEISHVLLNADTYHVVITKQLMHANLFDRGSLVVDMFYGLGVM